MYLFFSVAPDTASAAWRTGTAVPVRTDSAVSDNCGSCNRNIAENIAVVRSTLAAEHCHCNHQGHFAREEKQGGGFVPAFVSALSPHYFEKQKAHALTGKTKISY